MKQILNSMLLIFVFAASGQNTDSLHDVINNSQVDTVKMEAMVSLINYYTYNNKDSAMALCRELIAFASDKENAKFLATAHKSLGNQFYLQANFANAMEEYLLALSLMEENGMHAKTAGILHNIGIIHIRWKHPSEALTYLRKAQQLNLNNKKYTWLNNNYQAMGTVYADLLNKPDSTFHYQKLALQICRDHKLVSGELVAHLNIGSYYFKAESYDSAGVHFNKALDLSEEHGFQNYLGDIYEKLGILAYQEGNFSEAEDFYNKAIVTYKKLSQNQNLIGAYRNAASNYFSLGKFKPAYEFAETALVLSDSVFSKAQQDRIAELEADYDLLVKDKELALTKKDAIIAEQHLAKESARLKATIGLAVGALAIALLVFVLYRNNKKNLNLIALKNEEITKANNALSDLISEKNSILNIVAHDFRSPLAKIKALADLMKLDQSLNDNLKLKIDRIHGNIDESNLLIQDLLEAQQQEQLHNSLHPEVINPLAELELIAAQHQETAHQKNIRINVSGSREDFITDQYRLHRLLDNLLSNALKFSPEEKTIDLHCAIENNSCVISIKDQGPGFTEEDKKNLFKSFQKLSAKPIGNAKSHGLGLSIVKRMVNELQGTIQLESTQGRGALFTIQLHKLA